MNTIITSPNNYYSESNYHRIWEIWNQHSNCTFSFDIFYKMTHGDLNVAIFISKYCTSSRRTNFIMDLYSRGFTGKSLQAIIMDVCGGSSLELDKLMLKMEDRIINTADLEFLSQEHRKVRYL